MILPGTPDEYREHPEGSRQFWRFVDGEAVGPSTWVADGLDFADVFERRNNPPPPPVVIPYGAFLSRWRDEELEALFGARKANWRVDNMVTLAAAQDSVNLSGPTAGQAKALFVALKVLTAERADAIFAA